VRRPAAGAGAARQQRALQAGPAVEALALGEHLVAEVIAISRERVWTTGTN
jgi:hypothetical protein